MQNNNAIQLSQGKLFIISAPSGAGKTTLVQALLQELKNDCCIDRVVTYTTKKPRVTEEHGKDYHFVTREEFEIRKENQFFLEWSSFYDYYYGTPSSIIQELQQGKSLILIIDRVGARQLVAHIPDAVTIWIYPPSFDELRSRLLKRGTETQEQIERRLAKAEIEMAQAKAENLYKYHLNNDIFQQALYALRIIVLQELEPKNTVLKINKYSDLSDSKQISDKY